METHNSHEQFLQHIREDVIARCHAILDGRLGIVAGARELKSLLFQLGLNQGDDDLCTLIGIESETDHLPVGQVREQWDPEALKVKDQELARAEAFYKDTALAICRSLLVRFQGTA